MVTLKQMVGKKTLFLSTSFQTVFTLYSFRPTKPQPIVLLSKPCDLNKIFKAMQKDKSLSLVAIPPIFFKEKSEEISYPLRNNFRP